MPPRPREIQRPQDRPEKRKPDEGCDADRHSATALPSLRDLTASAHTRGQRAASSRSSIKRARRDDREGHARTAAPRARSARRCTASPTASVNSLAIDAEIVVPGASSEALMRCALPITKVTAIVSPERAPEPEHDAADDAGARIRHHDLPDDLPGASRRGRSQTP